MPSKRTTHASDPTFLDVQDATAIPANPMEALMQAAPGDEPDESWQEKHERFEPLRDALESGVLTEREVWVIEAMFWRRQGLRNIGAELSLSKTQVSRIRDTALAKLATALTGDTQ